MIVSGSASQALAASLAAETDEELAAVEYDRFPDGEFLVRIPDLTDERAIVVAATPSSEAHIELLQLQDAAREAGANEVVTVVPYLGYGRQDEAFEPGEAVSARAVARAISTGADRVVVVNPHERSVLEHFDVPATAVDASAQLADPLPRDLTDPLFLAPDASATQLAESVRRGYGSGDTDHLEKTRHDGETVSVEPGTATVSGRDVVLVDDIVATGTTMSEAIGHIDADGAERVFVSCVHPLLAATARTKLERAGVAGIYGTDTLERSVTAVSVAPTITEEL
jgi:ribose-phosphate pyrophosphokinase